MVLSLYDQIGKNYNTNRTTDPGILKKLLEFLQLERSDKVVEIGAGTGNYASELADKGIIVYAVEPSDIMLEQRKDHQNIYWQKGIAEKLDLDSNSYDGAYIVLAIHHFDSIQKAFEEVCRILKPNKNFVIFASDPRTIKNNYWLKDYFGELIDKVESSYPTLDQVKATLKKIFKNETYAIPFNIPHDMKDGFFFSGWQKPEKYLDAAFRKNISVFAKSPEDMVMKNIKRLERDLKNGEWDKNYSEVRKLKEYDGGYYFIKVKK